MSPRFARESEGFLRPPGALADFFTPSELLRAIADALDCPIPPFVEALESQTLREGERPREP
jgi:hypothetical protein